MAVFKMFRRKSCPVSPYLTESVFKDRFESTVGLGISALCKSLHVIDLYESRNLDMTLDGWLFNVKELKDLNSKLEDCIYNLEVNSINANINSLVKNGTGQDTLHKIYCIMSDVSSYSGIIFEGLGLLIERTSCSHESLEKDISKKIDYYENKFNRLTDLIEGEDWKVGKSI